MNEYLYFGLALVFFWLPQQTTDFQNINVVFCAASYFIFHSSFTFIATLSSGFRGNNFQTFRKYTLFLYPSRFLEEFQRIRQQLFGKDPDPEITKGKFAFPFTTRPLIEAALKTCVLRYFLTCCFFESEMTSLIMTTLYTFPFCARWNNA